MRMTYLQYKDTMNFGWVKASCTRTICDSASYSLPSEIFFVLGFKKNCKIDAIHRKGWNKSCNTDCSGRCEPTGTFENTTSSPKTLLHGNISGYEPWHWEHGMFTVRHSEKGQIGKWREFVNKGECNKRRNDSCVNTRKRVQQEEVPTKIGLNNSDADFVKRCNNFIATRTGTHTEDQPDHHVAYAAKNKQLVSRSRIDDKINNLSKKQLKGWRRKFCTNCLTENNRNRGEEVPKATAT